MDASIAITIDRVLLNVAHKAFQQKVEHSVDLVLSHVGWLKPCGNGYTALHFLKSAEIQGSLLHGIGNLDITFSSPLVDPDKEEIPPLLIAFHLDGTEEAITKVLNVAQWIMPIFKADERYIQETFEETLPNGVGFIQFTLEFHRFIHRKFRYRSYTDPLLQKPTNPKQYLESLIVHDAYNLAKMLQNEPDVHLSPELITITEGKYEIILKYLKIEDGEDAANWIIKNAKQISANMIKSDPITWPKIRPYKFDLGIALQKEGSERITEHIFNNYSSGQVRLSFFEIEKLRESIVPSPDSRTNPKAFYLISELLCLFTENPITFACKMVKLAKEHQQGAESAKESFRVQQWNEIRRQCEERAVSLLDVTSQTIPSEVGELGPVWMMQLLRYVPDKALEAESESIAGHSLCADVITERWDMRYTDWCWGTSFYKEEDHTIIPVSSIDPNATTKKKDPCDPCKAVFDSPSVSFWASLLSYLIFVSLFSAYVMWTDADLYDFNSSLVKQVITPTSNDGDQLNFREIDSVDSFWSWANVALGDSILDPENNITYSAVLFTNITLRQFRVNPTVCPAVKEIQCYEELKKDRSNWQTGGTWKGSIWDSTSGHTSIIPIYNPGLPTGGYVINLPVDQNVIVETLAELQNSSWIDSQTRVVLIEFSLFNPNGFYGLANIYIEWTPIGVVSTSYFFEILPFANLVGHVSQILLMLISLYCVGYFVQEIFQFSQSKDKFEYLQDFWNWVDFAIFSLFLIQLFVFTLVGFYTKYNISDEFDPTLQDFSSLHYEWTLYTIETYINSAFFMMFWFRFVFFFRSFRLAGPILKIVEKMCIDVIRFSFFVAFVVGGVCFVMEALLRDKYEQYCNFGQTYLTLSLTVVGGGDFLSNDSGGRNIFQSLGDLIYFVYAIIIVILLINLLIALMGNTYSEEYSKAMGLWSLESVAVLRQYESISWPVPLNIISFLIIYIWTMIYTPNGAQYFTARKHGKGGDSWSCCGIDEDTATTTSTNTTKQSGLRNDDYIQLDSLEQDGSKIGLKKRRGAVLRKISQHNDPNEMLWTISPNLTDSFNMTLSFELINETDTVVYIFLLLGKKRHYSFPLYPKTTAVLPNTYLGYKWLAYVKDRAVEEGISGGEDEEFKMARGTRIEPCYSISPSQLVLIEVSDLISAHCNMCSNIFTEGMSNPFGVVPEEYLNKPPQMMKSCSVLTCLDCYYRSKLEGNLKSEEVASTIKRSSWWTTGRLVELDSKTYNDIDRNINHSCCLSITYEPKNTTLQQISAYQNQLVQLILLKYRLRTKDNENLTTYHFRSFPVDSSTSEEQVK